MAQRILVVEDEPAIADNIVYALDTEGFEVQRCCTAEDALRMLANQPISLIVLDIGLPDRNGFELCKQIRKSSAVPIIFLTARTDEVYRPPVVAPEPEPAEGAETSKPVEPAETLEATQPSMTAGDQPAARATLEELLAKLEDQEQWLADGGVWLYQVTNKEARPLPEGFDETAFREGLAKLKVSPSYEALYRAETGDCTKRASASERDGTVPGFRDTGCRGTSFLIESVTPLNPFPKDFTGWPTECGGAASCANAQKFLKGSWGNSLPKKFPRCPVPHRELHEFVRYTVSEEGALVKQEVVRRFFEGPTAQPRLS